MSEKQATLARSYRQGDVLLVPCPGVPVRVHEEPAEGGAVILARGETTGHAHTMAADRVRYFRDDGTGQGFVQVTDFADLRHEEHRALAIPPGNYRVVRQREYLPRDAPRQVID